MKNTYYKEYRKTINLSSKEKELIVLCKKMLKECGNIYSFQVNSSFPGCNFYPRDVSSKEIIKHSKKDKDFLSPYTVVKRDKDGNLFSVLYSEEYKESLSKISQLAKKAYSLSSDKELATYLKKLSKACLDNSWEDLENYWLSIDGANKIDLQLAPIEPYMDGLLSIKHAFQGTLRISGDRKKFNPDDYISVISYINTQSNYLRNKTVRRNDQVSVRIDDCLALAGDQAALPARGSNYPNDIEKVKKYGTKILIYTDNIRLREEKLTLPILTALISPEFLGSISKDRIFDNLVRSVMMHEIAEALIKYPNSVKRLKDMYIPVKELHASLMGAKVASFHVLKGVLDHKDYKLLLLFRFVGRTFSDYFSRVLFGKAINHYVRGYTVAFNYFLKNGAVGISERRVWVNYPKLFSAVDSLSIIFDRLMAEGSFEDAKKLFKKYEDYSFYKPFEHKISKLILGK